MFKGISQQSNLRYGWGNNRSLHASAIGVAMGTVSVQIYDGQLPDCNTEINFNDYRNEHLMLHFIIEY